jgi:hypothetical protein
VAEVHLPRSLLPLFAGLPAAVDAGGTTAGEALAELDRRWPGLLDRLCEPGPRLRRHIRVFVDREPAGLSTPVGPRSRVDVIAAITGG